MRLYLTLSLLLISLLGFARKDTLYTQVNMWVYKSKVSPINYSIDAKIPVNTRVVVTWASDGYVKFHMPNDKKTKYSYQNSSRHSGLKNASEVLERYFASTPVDLNVFSEKEQAFIKYCDGSYEKGISKEALLVARGYPPIHRTVSLELDSWFYFIDRWTEEKITFRDGKIYSVDGVPLKDRE